MRNRSFLVACGSALLLVGCATQQDYKFQKANAPEAEFHKDKTACEDEAFTAPEAEFHKDKTACEDEAFTAGNVFTLKYIEARNNCMVKKGWTLLPK
ncbi:MAG: hypothetical protein RLZZ140_693 [Pseudomonadota bacterium]